MAWNWPRISPEDIGELSAGKLGSSIGVDISSVSFVFRRPFSTSPARRLKPRIGSHPHCLNIAAQWRAAADTRL